MRIHGIRPEIAPKQGGAKETLGVKPNFGDVLQAKTKEQSAVVFSKHASARLSKRNIPFGPAEMKRLAEAVDLAGSKGIRNALVIADDVVFVVNVPSRTVVTAIDRDSMKDKVFTNVDGAVNI